MTILGIESSCDDTSIALVNFTDRGFIVIAEKTASQIDVHKKYGGVVPEIAGRKHAEKILPTIEEVMLGQPRPDIIAVTAGPGLITGLLVGVEVAKTLSYLWDVPIVRTNHIEGHIYSVQIHDTTNKKEINFTFPALCLIVSGGHTELLFMTDHGQYFLIGKTRDDAAGECFDKVAKLLGLEYPGGPKISALAAKGNEAAINFPRPMIKKHEKDFSFSGLKTAALYWLKDNAKKGEKGYIMRGKNLYDFCASFEQAIIDVLVEKTLQAASQYPPQTIILGGGVSANKKLKETLQKKTPISNFRYPMLQYAMDNAAMIAVAGYYHAKIKDITPWQKLEADPQWKVYQSALS